MRIVYLIQQDVDDGTQYSDFKYTKDIGIALTSEVAERVKKKYDAMIPEMNEATGARHLPCDIFDITLFEESDVIIHLNKDLRIYTNYERNMIHL